MKNKILLSVCVATFLFAGCGASEKVEQLENQPLDYGIAANLKALFFKGFFIGIYSLILAAILKKKQPEPGF